MKNVITISRQKGSGGAMVAERLAGRLRWRIVGKDLISETAAREGIDEAKIQRVFESRISLQDRMTFRQRSEKYLKAVARAIETEADRGDVVIVGRGGSVILAADPRPFRVHFVADFDVRIERVASALKLRGKKGLDEARRRVNESDYARAAFHNYLFNVDWNSPMIYDLVINTTEITVDQAADMTRKALEAVLPGFPP